MGSLSNQSYKKKRNPGNSGQHPHHQNNSDSGSQGGQTVKFARRTSSERYTTLSQENLDVSRDISGDYMKYTVHNSLFTSGFNSVTRAHLMDKVIDNEVRHPRMVAARASGQLGRRAAG